MVFFTIGVYNSSEAEFFGKLTKNGIDTFCDIRQRRGVRGAKYAFVNSKRLQGILAELDIRYVYVDGLAPTKEIRELQQQADKENKELKSNRLALGEVFKVNFREKIIRNFDFLSFIEGLKATGAERVAIFCVEERPEACHRSLVIEPLQKLEFQILHL